MYKNRSGTTWPNPTRKYQLTSTRKKKKKKIRSLIAHEQMSKERIDFTMYAIIMDSLIDTKEDFAILQTLGQK